MIKIYNIIDKNGLRYVGKTKQDLNNRLAQHKYDRKLNRNCSSKVLDLDNCIILLIEECSKEKTKEREQFWISKLKCVNQYNGNFDRIDYMKNYYDKNKQKRKEWYQENKEQIKKKYHENKT